MNAVIVLADLLLATDMTGTQRRYVQTLKNSGAALLILINDILDIAKIESGNFELNPTPFNLAELMENLADSIAIQAHNKNIDFVIGLPSEVPVRLIGDSNRLRQILYNLLSNAVKFTAQGEVLFSVQSLSISETEAKLQFTVKDTGIGIEENRLEKIFEKFFQADSSITREYGGTGLGLAIAKLLTDLHHGTLEVESSRGQGTSFRLTLALPRQDGADMSITIPGNQKGVVAIGNATRREKIKRRLRTWGVAVESLESWPALLRFLADHSAAEYRGDFLMVDSCLPGFSETGLLGSLKENNWPAGLKVILLVPIGHSFDNRFAWAPYSRRVINTPVKRRDLATALSAVPASGSNAGELSGPLSSGKKDSFAGARILLAEDNTINQLVARAVFQNFGIDIVVAGNGLEAVELLRKEPFDLVFMDIQMPQMDGLTAAKQIRRMENAEARSPTPIVAMTAHALKGDKERLMAEGMDDYIAKPISMDFLLEILHRWLPLKS